MRPQAQLLAVGVDHDVADLAGRGAVPVEQRALEDQAGTDAGPDPEHHQAAVPGVAERVLAEDRGVGVVGDEDRDVRARAAGCGRAGCPYQPRLGASTTVPSASTTPGLPTPTPRTGRSVSAISAAASSRTRSTASAPLRPETASSLAGHDLAGEVDHGADHPVVGREVEADDVRGVGGEADQHRRLADPALRRAPELLDQALAHQLADQVGDGHPGQGGGAGQVGAAGRSVPEQLLEQQGPVVAAGVLLQQLAAGAERSANR